MYSDSSGHTVEWLLSHITGIAFQIDVSVICYVGTAIASIWDETIRNDNNVIILTN